MTKNRPEWKIGDKLRLLKAHYPAESWQEGRVGIAKQFRSGYVSPCIVGDSPRESADYVYAFADEWEHVTDKEEQTEIPQLDPADPFDRVVIQIVNKNRQKRADYAEDGDAFSNFRQTAELMGIEGFEATDAARFNMAQKMIRLKALSKNGRDPQNESVIDTFLDLAVYGIIQFAISQEEEKDA